ncbi:hypothetical protein N333_05637, partial [Nestor notabilis]
VGEVLVCVVVEEALGVVAGVREDLVHLLVEVAAPVGHLHGQAVAVHGVDDAAGGDLGLEQADAVLLDDELLLHGLEEGDLLSCAGVGVAYYSSLCREKFLLELTSYQPRGDSFIHRELLFSAWVNDEASSSLCLQQHQGCALPQDALPHGLVDAHLLQLAGLGLAGHQHTSDAASSFEVFSHTVHLSYFFCR